MKPASGCGGLGFGAKVWTSGGKGPLGPGPTRVVGSCCYWSCPSLWFFGLAGQVTVDLLFKRLGRWRVTCWFVVGGG